MKKSISFLRKKAKDLFRKKLIRNILLVGSLTVLVKVIGFYKETLTASTFGLSELLDTFYIAFLVPGFIQSVFIGSIKNVFIPNYITGIAKNKDRERGSFQAVTFGMVLSVTLLLIILTLVFDKFFLEMIFSGHTSGFYHLVHTQLYILIPCLLFWGLSSIIGGLLEIEDRFFHTSIQPIFTASTVIFSLLFLHEYLGDYVLAISTLMGSFLSLIYLMITAFQFKVIKIGRPKLNEATREMMVQLPAKISSGFLTGLNKFVDQFFSAQLAVGSISALNYGIKIPSLILTISMIVIGNVMLPHFSKKLLENRLQAFKELFKILKILFLAGLVLNGLIYVYSVDIISLLFERNEFTAEDTKIVARIQQIIIIYVPFYLCGNLLGKFLTSINRNSFMAWVSLYNLIANVVLNIIFVRYYGVYGLAMSTTIVISVSSFIYFFYVIKQYRLTRKGEF